MALYQKINGVWTVVQRPYVLHNGVWTAVTDAYVRRSNVWVSAYHYDVTPPNPPEIDLRIFEDFNIVKGQKQLASRWIQVGVRLPGSLNQTDARLARVLTTYAGKPPTSPLGGTYTSAPDSDFPGEAWGDWKYNEFGVHDTSISAYKQWPRNASAGTIIKGDTTYYFGGWSLDRYGNWSVATQASIHVPKDSVGYPQVVVKEARFQPNASGSWRGGQGFQTGDLIQQWSPGSTGLWFYGAQFTDSMGSSGSVTVRSAQIYIKREDDTGLANANVYLYWTGYPTVASLPAPGPIQKFEITKIGTLAKGQGAWFDLPISFRNNMNYDIKGLGLDYKDPVKATGYPNDYSQVSSVASKLRCGEVHVVWEEQL